MHKSRYGKDVNEVREVQLKTPKFSKPSFYLKVRMLVWQKEEPTITEGAEGQLASFLRINPSKCWTYNLLWRKLESLADASAAAKDPLLQNRAHPSCLPQDNKI